MFVLPALHSLPPGCQYPFLSAPIPGAAVALPLSLSPASEPECLLWAVKNAPIQPYYRMVYPILAVRFPATSPGFHTHWTQPQPHRPSGECSQQPAAIASAGHPGYSQAPAPPSAIAARLLHDYDAITAPSSVYFVPTLCFKRLCTLTAS